MKRMDGKERMDADQSAPMPTKGRKGADFRNQTTEVPKNRFPWTTIITVLAFIVFIAVVIGVLQMGTS